MATKTIEVYPSEYILGTVRNYNDIENAYTPSDSATYAEIGIARSANSETYIYFTFDLSTIPDDAIIHSISCTAKVRGISSILTTQTVQLYSGTSAKGSPTTIPTTARVVTLTPGSWDRNELNDIRIKLYGLRNAGSLNFDLYMCFYGATLIVEYEEVSSISGNANIGGTFKELSGGYANIGGVWKEMVGGYVNTGGTWKESF